MRFSTNHDHNRHDNRKEKKREERNAKNGGSKVEDERECWQ